MPFQITPVFISFVSSCKSYSVDDWFLINLLFHLVFIYVDVIESAVQFFMYSHWRLAEFVFLISQLLRLFLVLCFLWNSHNLLFHLVSIFLPVCESFPYHFVFPSYMF